MFFKEKRIYLDYASSTPLDLSMLSKFPKIPRKILSANPSALHKEGVELRKYLESSRDRCAKILDVHKEEIVFTSGATESDTIAIVGSVYGFLAKGIAHKNIFIFSSDMEHSAVSESVKEMNSLGVNHIVLNTEEGVVNLKDIHVPYSAKAIIVSILYVNNEIGTVQPISEISKKIRSLKKENPGVEIIFHTDATQAPSYSPLRIPKLGVDLMTLGSTKLYCPKGVGLLYKKKNISVKPINYGGGQEFGIRPGTEPVELIHQFSNALKYANDLRERETKRTREFQKYFESQIEKNFPKLKITAKNQLRAPHITHIGMPNFDSELMIIELDARGIAVSAKSACKNEETGESEIVEKIYGKGWGAVRFSFGRQTTKKQIKKAIFAIKNVFKKYKI